MRIEDKFTEEGYDILVENTDFESYKVTIGTPNGFASLIVDDIEWEEISNFIKNSINFIKQTK